MFKKIRRAMARSRLSEEALYGQALEELERGIIRSGLWGKALAGSNGDETAAKASYLQYRVQSMLDESDLAQAEIERLMSEKTISEMLQTKAFEMEEKERQRRVKRAAKAAGAKYSKT